MQPDPIEMEAIKLVEELKDNFATALIYAEASRIKQPGADYRPLAIEKVSTDMLLTQN
jgi:hypothetical protein